MEQTRRWAWWRPLTSRSSGVSPGILSAIFSLLAAMTILSSFGAGTSYSSAWIVRFKKLKWFEFRNRPGDSMRDKYNLNTLPPGHEEEYGNLGESKSPKSTLG